MANAINRYAVVDQTTGNIVHDNFTTRHAAQIFIDNHPSPGAYWNWSVEDAPWNVYDDSECEH